MKFKNHIPEKSKIAPRAFVFLFALLLSTTSFAQDSANGLVYHGRVLKPNGDALEDANVNFTVRIYGKEASPVAKRCLLYEETHSGVNMTGTLGTFELKIGEGTRTFTPPQVGVGGIGRLFLNSPSFTLTTTACTAGTNDFTAESLDADRELEVTIQSGATVLNLPAQKLRAMPWAMQAMEIGGYSADYLAKLNAAVPSQMSAGALMYLSNNAVVNDNGTPTNYSDDTARLQNLIDPTNPQDAATKNYVDTAVGAGFSAGNGISIAAGVIATKVDNATIEFDGSGIMRVKALGIGTGHIADGAITAVKLNQMAATPGQVLKWNGSSWAPAADDDSATTYTAGDGLALTGSDFAVNVDNVGVEINADTLRLKDGGVTSAKILDGAVSYVDLNSSGATVNDGMIVSDSSGRLFKLQCAGNQVANWSMSNGWECINPSSLAGVQSNTLATNNMWIGNGSNVAAAVALPTCAANQYITYDGSAWSCATDVGSAGSVASAQGTAAVKVNGDNAAHTGAVTISVDDATVAAKGLMQVGNGLQVAAGVVSVSAPTCTAGQYISYNGTTWSCSAPTDNDTTYTAGDALTLTGNDFDVAVDNSTIEVNADALRVKDAAITAAKLNQMGASNNEILKWNGSAWAPAPDAGITSVAGQTLNQHQIWQGDVSNLAAAVTVPSCGANQYLKYNNAGGWTCENDAGASGTVADIASTAPVKVNGVTSAQTGSVVVSVDDATAVSKGIMQVGTGLSVSSGTVSVDYSGIVRNIAGTPSIETGTFALRPAFGTAGRIYIASDTNAIYRDTGAAWVLIGDGTGTGDVTDVTVTAPLAVTNSSGPNPNVSITAGSATGDILQWNGSAWANNTVATCAGGQYLSFNGTTWACSAPAGTTYTGGDGLALTGSDFSVNVDNSTIEINADTLRVKDAGITLAKINSSAYNTGEVASTLVMRDGSSNIEGSGILGDSLIMKGSTSGTVTLQAPVAPTSYSLTFPSAQGGANQVLQNNGSGVLSWAAPNPVGSSLNQHQIWLGNVSNLAAAVTLPNCGANQVLKYDNASGFTCQNDAGASGTVADIASTAPVKVNGVTSAQTGSVVVSVDDATAVSKGIMQVGTGLGVSSGTVSVTYGTTAGTAAEGNDTRLSDARTPVGTALTSANIWLGNAGNTAAAVNPSGDVDIDNAGVFSITADSIVNADINSAANIDASKLGTGVVSNTEFNYLDGVTSAIQTQLDAKVANGGGTPSITTGTFAARPAFGTAGRIYIASDTNAIYRDTGAAWVLIGDGAGTGDVTDVTVTAPLAVTNSSGPNPNVSISAGGATGDILQWNGSAWANNTVDTCAGGEFLSFDGTTWTCSAPAGTTYTGGDGLTLTGNDFDVNVDNSTLEINADTLRVKDAGITLAKINSSAYNTGEVASTLVMRDGSSNIEGSGILGDALIMKGSTSGTVTLQAPVAPTSYSLTFPSAQGSANQVLQNNGSGVLSWVTPSGTMGGSGTTGMVPKFTAAATIGDSSIQDEGGGVIDFTGAGAKIKFNNVDFIRRLANDNIGVGQYAAATATGVGNIAVGTYALSQVGTGYANAAIDGQYSNDTGYGNISMGVHALHYNTSSNLNTGLGYYAGENLTGGNNTAVGANSITAIVAGTNNTALGKSAGENANGASSNNVFIGYSSGPTAAGAVSNKLYIDNSANNTPLIGGDFSANTVDINGSLNIAFAGGYLNYKPNNSECSNDDYLKWDATNDRWICTAPSGGVGGSGTTNRLAKFTAASTVGDSLVGENSANVELTLNGTRVLSTRGTRNLYLGNSGNNTFTTGSSVDNIGIGTRTVDSLTTGDSNVAMGTDTGTALTTGWGNVALGYSALLSSTDGAANIAIGPESMKYTTGTGSDGRYNVAIGYQAMQSVVEGAENVAIGYQALGGAFSTYRTHNSTSVGSTSLMNSNPGLYQGNDAFGHGALYNMDTGYDNAGFGYRSLYRAVSGVNNTAIGRLSGQYANGASSNNVFIGYSSGPTAAGAVSNKLYIDNSANNTPLIGGDFSANTVDINGSLNINFAGGYLNYKPNATECTNNDTLRWDATNDRWLCQTPSGGMGGSGTTGTIPRFTASSTLGDSILQVDTNGTLNIVGTLPKLQFNGINYLHTGNGTAPGYDGNTFVGQASGNTTLTGANNNSLGYIALMSLTTGNYNVALGSQAMRYTTSGTSNVAVGSFSLQSTNTGSQNVGIGDSSGTGNTSGAGNVAIGYESMDAKTTGDDNVAVGRAALGTLGTGGTNVAIGSSAGGTANGASAGNVFVGYSAGPTGAGAISNKLYIDNSANDDPLIYGDFSSNRVGINTGSPSEALEVSGNVKATSFISTSDRRLKTNIRSIAGMSAINQLRGVQYEWRADGTSDAGVIAQEVEKVFPAAVRTDAVTGLKAVKYNYLIAPLIEATKENYNMCKQSEEQIKQIQRSIASIQAKDSAQDRELQALRAENAALKNRLDAIEKKLGIK